MNIKFKEKFFINCISNLIIFVVLISMFFITLYPNSQTVFGTNKPVAIYNGNRESNKVSLMFNVYWGTEYISDILKVLNNYNVKTTFFIGGQWAEKEHQKLQEIYNSGHELGNHGYFHKEHSKLSYNQNKDELSVCHAVVKKITGYDMTLFAPPSGDFNKTTLQVATDLNYKTIMWSKDTIDWRDKDDELVFTRATKKVIGGDLILMHPTAHTLKALPQILNYFLNNGLQVSTVSNTLN